MYDKILLLPYYLTLKIRNGSYDKGHRKQHRAEVPTICIGNVTAGGTGKTPHTEMILKMLLHCREWEQKNIAVLSRGYKRKSRGFQQVAADGTATFYGDEPLQIKKKFPGVTVALDADRVEGCHLLCHPDKVRTSRKTRKCANKNFPAADIIVLDDAFQHRSLKADVNIVLVDYNRPVFEDHLLPFGSLRDLPERISDADIIIVTKCPYYLTDEEKEEWKNKVRLKYGQKLFFTRINYCQPVPVYPGICDTRYTYSKKMILFTGIAKDTPLRMFLSDSYKLVEHFRFPDHHTFRKSDVAGLLSAVRRYPMAAVGTTEKDAQRIIDCDVPHILKERMFQIPIETGFFSEEEEASFRDTLFESLGRKAAQDNEAPIQ